MAKCEFCNGTGTIWAIDPKFGIATVQACTHCDAAKKSAEKFEEFYASYKQKASAKQAGDEAHEYSHAIS